MAEHNHKKEQKKRSVLLTLKEYEALKEKAEAGKVYDDKLLRMYADFDNYKKRLEKEKIEFIKFANEGILMGVLKILDDFERAVEAGKSKHDFDMLYKGIEMIHKDIKEFLKQNGMEVIAAKGKAFNPHEHEAMMQEETDKHPEDYVTEEFQKGYKFHGRIIRPSKVKVSKKPEDKTGESE